MCIAAAAITGIAISGPASVASAAPVTGLHYAPNGDISGSGAYLPGALGFNLADISASWVLAYLPKGSRYSRPTTEHTGFQREVTVICSWS